VINALNSKLTGKIKNIYLLLHIPLFIVISQIPFTYFQGSLMKESKSWERKFPIFKESPKDFLRYWLKIVLYMERY